MSLRVGVACAVVDDAGAVLLSRRRDFGFWNLPAGRLDPGETLMEAAAREVREETGVAAHVDRAVGLYYWPGFSQLTILFAGWPVGGTLLPQTDESRENRYFAPDALPDYPRRIMTLDALAGTRHRPRVLDMTRAARWRLKLALRLRWLGNRLRGQPEPPYHTFETSAAGVIFDEGHSRVLALQRRRTEALPRVTCAGGPPWEELAALAEPLAGESLSFRWTGVWQDVEAGQLELIFAAACREGHALPEPATWTLARNAALPARDARYVARVGPGFARDPVWLIGRDTSVRAGDTLYWNKETRAWY